MKKKKIGAISLFCVIAVFLGSFVFAAEEVVIGIHPSPWYPAFKAMVDKYMQETGNKIKLLEFPHPTLMENEMIAAREGADTFDIMSIDDSYLPFFVGGERRFLTPIKEIDPNFELGPEFIDFKNSFKWSHEHNYSHPDGVLYGIPTQGNFQMFFYRGDLFQEAGLSVPPQTWKDVEVAASKLHNPPKLFGYATVTVAKLQAVYFWMPILRSFGGKIFEDPPYDWTVTINSKEVADSLNWIVNMSKYCPPGIGNTSQSDVLSYLGNGQLAQALNVTAIYPFMDDPNSCMFPGKVDFASPPAGETGIRFSTIGNWLAVIPKGAKRKKEALEFLKWFLKPENQVFFGESGGIPSNLEAIKALAAREGREWRFFRAYLETFEFMGERPRIMEWPRIEDVMGTYFQKVVTGEIEVEEALKKMESEIEKIMQEAGFLK